MVAYPGATEYCNDVDDDCDLTIDEDAVDATAYYLDGDDDGYGDVLDPGVGSCEPVADAVTEASDCDDSEPAVNPSATEICDGVDDDCNEAVDDVGPPLDWYPDADGDGYGLDDGVATQACAPAPEGWVEIGGDCDDGEAAVSPVGVESCDGIDDDCDGQVDAEDPRWWTRWVGGRTRTVTGTGGATTPLARRLRCVPPPR